jgi:hypothetical protein
VAGVREGPPATLHTKSRATQAPPPAHHPHCTPPQRTKHVFRTGLSTAWRIARVGCRAMPTRRGTFSRPYVGRDPRKGQGEIPGAEQSAPELGAIPGGHAKKVPNRAPTYSTLDTCYSRSLSRVSGLSSNVSLTLISVKPFSDLSELFAHRGGREGFSFRVHPVAVSEAEPSKDSGFPRGGRAAEGGRMGPAENR